jgi:hypothetical protein
VSPALLLPLHEVPGGLKGNKDWRLKDPAALAAFRAAVKEYG